MQVQRPGNEVRRNKKNSSNRRRIGGKQLFRKSRTCRQSHWIYLNLTTINNLMKSNFLHYRTWRAASITENTLRADAVPIWQPDKSHHQSPTAEIIARNNITSFEQHHTSPRLLFSALARGSVWSIKRSLVVDKGGSSSYHSLWKKIAYSMPPKFVHEVDRSS